MPSDHRCNSGFLADSAIDPVATFYLPFTRAFELLAGAALARVGTTSARPARRAMSAPIAGMALIALAAGLLNSQSLFPGW